MSVAMNAQQVAQMNMAQAAGKAGSGHAACGSGRLCDPTLSDSDKNLALAMHLSPLVLMVIFGPIGFVVSLVIWLTRKDDSPFLNDHGRESLNLFITGVIFYIGLGLIPVLGWLALVIWNIVIFIGMIRASIAGAKGEFFRYPMLIRFL